MRRIVAECVANQHLGIYEDHTYSGNDKCPRCGHRGLRRLTDEDGHKDMPLKQAQRFVMREEERRKKAKETPDAVDEAQVA